MAHVLGRRIAASHKVLQVYSRQPQHAAYLANLLNCEGVSHTGQITTLADLYVIAIADSALPHFCQQWTGAPAMIVHTAGTVPLDVLKPLSRRYGVLYPLQSLRKERSQYQDIPLLVEAGNHEDLPFLLAFARSLSPTVYPSTGHQRSKLHVAAVLVNNFANYLYAQAQAYCNAQELDFNLLLPLMHETVDRLHTYPARYMQTGPAVRGDLLTIHAHLEILKDMPELANLYQYLTGRILAQFGPKP